MNVEWYIARRLLKGDGRKSVSVRIVKIATGGIAAGLCVMLLSVFVILGFKQEITMKLSGFAAHLKVVPNAYMGGEEMGSIEDGEALVERLRDLDGVKQVYAYSERPAIFKSKDEIHGVMTKGVDSTYDPIFFKNHLISGYLPDFKGKNISDEVLISASIADYLNVKMGDKIVAHFVQDPPRARAFVISGIYDTGFKEYDDVMVLIDRRHLTKLNNWSTGEVSGVAVELLDVDQIAGEWEKIDDVIYAMDKNYTVRTLRDEAPQIFDWLNLLNMNVWVILFLIVTVAGFNMVSGLLILILDKTMLIGLLKALGCRNISLRRLFLYVAGGLMLHGMLWGNVSAFFLSGVQYYFKLIHLDPVAYYMDTVPVCFNIWAVLILNAGVIVVTIGMLIIPTMMASMINPVRVIQYE